MGAGRGEEGRGCASEGSDWSEKSFTPMATSWRRSDQSVSTEPDCALVCFCTSHRNREQLAETAGVSSSLRVMRNARFLLDGHLVAAQNARHNRGEIERVAEEPVALERSKLPRGLDRTH